MAATIYPSHKSSSHRSSIPRLNFDAAMASQTPPPPSPKPNSGGGTPPPKPGDPNNYRLLSHPEWVQFCRGIGVLKDDESEVVVRPTSRWWPPKGFRDGLYKDVLFEKAKFTYWFHLVSTLHWVLMLVQIALSAVLTALGSVSSTSKNGVTIVSSSRTDDPSLSPW